MTAARKHKPGKPKRRNLRKIQPDETTKFLRRVDVEQRYCIKTSTLYEWIAGGHFPAPVKIGAGRAARWPVEELDAYDVQRAAEREAQAAA